MVHRIRDYDKSKPVEVYKNLNSGLLSVRQNGLIAFYTESIQLKNVELIVKEAGRQAFLKSMRKNVHAYARGYVNEMELSFTSDKILYYNPLRTKTFVDECGIIKREVEDLLIHSDGRMFYL